MAQKPGRAPFLLKALLRQWRAAERRDAVHSDLRAEWRKFRRRFTRAEGATILQALRAERSNQRSHRPGKPVPWSVESAVRALSRGDVHVKFFGAMRLLQAAHAHREPVGYGASPDREAVRIDQALLLGFTGLEVPSVEFNRIDTASAKHPSEAGLAAAGSTTGRAVLSQFAVGLLGPNGPMPFVWTEHAFHLQRGMGQANLPLHLRRSFMAFLNVLQRRQLSFLYRAWSDAQAIVAMDSVGTHSRPHPIADRLRALAGLGHAELDTRDSIPPEFKLAFAATLSRRVRNPSSLSAMLSRYLHAPVQVEEFSPRWMDIPSSEQTRLGEVHAGLGTGAVAGARVLDFSSRFDVLVGPVDLDQYVDLLPGGTAFREVRDLVALYAGPDAEWQLRPILSAAEVPSLTLSSAEGQLGWSSWLGHRDSLDAADLALPMAPDFAPWVGLTPARSTAEHAAAGVSAALSA